MQAVLQKLHPGAFCVISRSLQRGSAQTRMNAFIYPVVV